MHFVISSIPSANQSLFVLHARHQPGFNLFKNRSFFPKLILSKLYGHIQVGKCSVSGRTFGQFFILQSAIKEYLNIARGDVKIPHSRMIKTCWETLVTCL